MFTADKFRAKAAKCSEQIGSTSAPGEIEHLRQLEQSFLSLAQNEDWLANNLDKIIHVARRSGDGIPGRENQRSEGA